MLSLYWPRDGTATMGVKCSTCEGDTLFLKMDEIDDRQTCKIAKKYTITVGQV